MLRFSSLVRSCLPLVVVGFGCAGVKAGAGTGGGQTGTGARAGSGASGGGGSNQGGGSGDGNCNHDLRAVVRDFRSGEKDGQPKHPDFEYVIGDDRGIVAAMLGPDSKPVYAGGPGGTLTTTGKDNFDQWYRDVDGINIHIDINLPLEQAAVRPGVFVYDNDLFYPIDDMGWGNQYLEHNQDFTVEMHFTFPYRGGEVFTFRGDDDLFLFVNGHLAIDLGGVHSAETASVDLDARAGDLGIAPGSSYQMDIFYADRHCCQSTFHVESTLSCIDNVIVP
jgi:fibro-slime domain-containing protein